MPASALALVAIIVVLALVRLRRGKRVDLRPALGRLLLMDDDSARQIDDFLNDALGERKQLASERPKEWIDEEPYEPPVTPELAARTRTDRLALTGAKVTVDSRFEPPLIRLRCTGCGNKWDSWVDDEGKLEDPRDVLCHCQKGEVVLAPDE